ncbi:hypothetical protein D3C73_1278770 [compost metagenome]
MKVFKFSRTSNGSVCWFLATSLSALALLRPPSICCLASFASRCTPWAWSCLWVLTSKPLPALTAPHWSVRSSKPSPRPSLSALSFGWLKLPRFSWLAAWLLCSWALICPVVSSKRSWLKPLPSTSSERMPLSFLVSGSCPFWSNWVG